MMSPEERDRQEGIEFDASQMAEWWDKYSAEMRDRTVPKAVAYGSADLRIMGNAMAELLPGLEGADHDERAKIGQMAAVSFYILGKVARQISAFSDGRMPPEDHEFDMSVYGFMQRRIRETGRWP